MKRLTQGNRVIAFIEKHCVFVSGDFQGKPFKLLPWQKKLINDLFVIDPSTNQRQYSMALVGTPKKNGKSELSAALALYFLLADGEKDPLVIIGAGSEEQAGLVYGAARKMAELSPTLSQITDRYDKEIISRLATGGKIRRVAAAVGTNDGLNVSAAILDELHEWQGVKGRSVFNVLTNGTISRRQPMVIGITTAGYDRESICYELYDYGKKVDSGEVIDRRFFFRWFEPLSENADYRSEETWRQANPSYGVTLTKQRLEAELRKPEAVFRRYFLNQWTEVENLWLPSGVWEKLADPNITLDTELKTWVAVDAATRNDSTAVVVGQWQGENLAVVAKIWERPFDAVSGKFDEDWRMPLAELENYLRDLYTDFPELEYIAYDPAFISWLAQKLEVDGLPMLEFPQTTGRMSPASQTLYDLCIQDKLRHNGAKDFARHIRNAAAEQTGLGNGAWRLVKKKAKSKMDAAIACAMVAALATKKIETEESNAPSIFVFDNNGNLIIDETTDAA
jgi:phage terminase large subunit-like protein